MSPLCKRAVFKLAVDVVKADNRIHKNEIAFLDALQRSFGLSGDELDIIHYMSMQQAVGVLKGQDPATRSAVAAALEELMEADSDIDFEEALLLSSIQMALAPESAGWSAVITALDCESDTPTRQVIYVEKCRCEAARGVLDDRYGNLLLTKALSQAGFELFYLPSVVEELNGCDGSGHPRMELLRRSMEYLVPAGDRQKVTVMDAELGRLDIPSFSSMVLSRHGIERDSLPYDACLLVRLKDSRLLDDSSDIHNTADFLCIDISCDVIHRILEFVSRMDTGSDVLSYDGYYKILFDCLSSESKTRSRIVLDADMEFCLQDMGGRPVVFKSAPQSKAFYLLLLKYGQAGVSQVCFNKAAERLGDLDICAFIDGGGRLDMLKLQSYLLSEGSEEAILISSLLEIYGMVSTKDNQQPRFVDYAGSIIRHRSSLKNYVNNAFMSVPKLSSPQSYCIRFDRETSSYVLAAGMSYFGVMEEGSGIVPLEQSEFWKRLRHA